MIKKISSRMRIVIGGGVFVLIMAVIIGVLWAAGRPEGEDVAPVMDESTTEVESDGVDTVDDNDDEAMDDEGIDDGENSDDNAAQGDDTDIVAGNCTANYGNLMLINPNFTVDEAFIAGRRAELISLSQTYGIPEYHYTGNGDNLMMPEAAAQLAKMISDYRATNPGHEIGTYSCYRVRGTSCGRLCAATGASDHHTGLTCDLIDLAYGSVLDTDDYPTHVEWQWLRENSYKYGFIDRFPEEWAGGPMSEPLNVDAYGSTGLFETWHYWYVGVAAATEIATGKYNEGRYDSLEHYLKVTGRVTDLKNGRC